jgi:hypothetical protein
VRCSGVKPLIKLLEMGRGLLPSPFSFARVVSMQVAKSLPGASAVEDVAEGGSFRRSKVGHWKALQADLAEAARSDDRRRVVQMPVQTDDMTRVLRELVAGNA